MEDFSELNIPSEQDELMLDLAAAIQAENEKKNVESALGISEILHTYENMQQIFDGSGLKIFYELHTPFKSNGRVVVEGEEIAIQSDKMELLVKSIRSAHDYNVYALSNGKIRMVFGFVNVMV